MKKSFALNSMFHRYRILSILLAVLIVSSAPAAFSQDVEKNRGAFDSILDSMEDVLVGGPLGSLRSQAMQQLGLAINPYFKSAFEYSSNVFRSPKPRQDGTIWRFSPGVNITYSDKSMVIGVGYEAIFNYFTKFGMQNEQDQNFSAFADFYPTEKLQVTASQDLSQVGSTAGAPGSEPVNIVDSTTRVSAIYSEDSWSTEGGYELFNREFASDLYDAFSYFNHSFYGRLTVPVNENIKAFGGADFGFVRYDENQVRNAFYMEFPVGIEGTLGDDESLYYRAQVGVHRRLQGSNVHNDWWGFVGNVNVRKQLTEKTAVEAGFIRRPVEASFATVSIYDEKLFHGNISHILSNQLRGRVDVFYANRDYEDAAAVGAIFARRSDDAVGVGVGFDYALRKWLVFNVDYRYEHQDSNIPDFDSTDNRFTVGMTMPL